MRRAARRDAAERDIITALEKAGATVHQLSGKDIPDLLVGARGHTYLLEVKSRIVAEDKGRKPRVREGEASDGQKKLHESWKGGTISVIHDPGQALHACGYSFEDANYTPPKPKLGCPACLLDPQSPCKHDGEEKGVAMGTQPPRRRNRRRVDEIVAERFAAATRG